MIDSRAPRTNQAVVGVVSVLAVATGWWWLLALLALQLALGLVLGRRYCLPCLLYFEVIQPRFGEGALEDSRPPRAANIVGLVVLTAASVAYAVGLATARRRPRHPRRGARAARGVHRLLHRLRGVQARLPAARAPVRLLPAAPARMTWQFSLAGLLIGVLVGMTGMGGGSLMTPMLILLFGFDPKTAVGTDILHGAVFKSFGAVRHRQLGNVHVPLAHVDAGRLGADVARRRADRKLVLGQHACRR